MKKQIKPGSVAHRSFAVDRAAVDTESRTVALAFSSEDPYERYWGIEILDHAKGSMRTERLKAGGPLLVGHNSDDHVGVIESVTLGGDRVGRAVVRFGKSARAEEIYQDVLDGIRRSVSVGYVIHRADLAEINKETGVDTYRVVDWEPFEVSIVSVPADTTVGIGRSAERADSLEFIETPEHLPPSIIFGVKNVDEATIEAQKKAGRDAEQKRASEIIAIGEHYASFGVDKIASQAIREGWTVDAFRAKAMEKLAVPPTASDIGLSQKETGTFSFLRAIRAIANPNDRKAQEEAGFERECSDAYAQKIKRAARGFFIPAEVQRRDLNVTTNTAGGHTVATEVLAGSFIDLLRNKMMVLKMGAQLLTGLQGNIALPRQTGGATAYWVAESGAPTESQATFDQVAMSPKTVGAFTDISRKLILQSSIDVENFVRNDLAQVIAQAIDLAAIGGTGASNQPTGLVTASIGDVAGGTNGAAPSWANIVALWSSVATANADFGSTGFLTNAKVAGKLMSTEKATNTAQFVCPGFPDVNGITSFGGARAGISNQVPSNLTKGTASGVCSSIIFGNWRELIIGQWGTLDLAEDRSTGSTSGTVRVIALQDVDVAIRHLLSFASMDDALTT